MSNARRPATGSDYRIGYLLSVHWFRRRNRWFAEQLDRIGDLACVVCELGGTRRDLELHHLDYTRVTRHDGRWVGGETHEDLCSMHSDCHELVHRILEADAVLRWHRSRPVATIHAIRIARARIAALDRARV